ncbi:hypothetical protein [Algivirga pacifica]|uniref:Uncharacterized protein n=1 Tax=Algivirga pacifica TaxID=1162670 RepID=A0ABP9D854_9BACT
MANYTSIFSLIKGKYILHENVSIVMKIQGITIHPNGSSMSLECIDEDQNIHLVEFNSKSVMGYHLFNRSLQFFDNLEEAQLFASEQLAFEN